MKKNVDDLIKEINYEKQNAIENGIIRKEKPQSEINEKDMYCKLPNNWRWIRLGDYCLKATDYVASGSFASIKSNVNYYNTENYALMVKTADFANNFTKNLTYTDESGYKFLSNSNLFGGELILSNIGSIGKVFKVPYLNRPMTLASNTIMIKFTNDKLADYIYYYFKSTYGQNALKSISSGTSMLKFNKTQLKTLPLPIPSLETQNKIVEALDKAQELIDKRKEQIEALDELVKSRFIEMFGSPKSNPNNFDVVKFNDITDYIGDIGSNGANSVISANLKMTDTEDYALMVRTLNFTSNDFENNVKYVSKEVYDFFKKSQVFGGELIFNKIGSAGINFVMPYLNRPVSLGLNQIMVRTNEKVNITYLHTLLNTDYGKHQIGTRVQGAVTKSITKGAIKEIPIILPPIELQNEFADFVKQVDKLKSQMETSLKELEDNFNSLMQIAFKGELF